MSDIDIERGSVGVTVPGRGKRREMRIAEVRVPDARPSGVLRVTNHSRPPPPALSLRELSTSRLTVGCFLAMFLCYCERIGFSIAFSDVARAQQLPESQIGPVLGAFFWGYAITMLPAGIIAKRWGGGTVLFTAMFAWSLLLCVTTIDPPASGYPWSLLISQVLIGCLQGLVIPALHALLAERLTASERAYATAFSTSGMYAGSAMSMMFLPILVEKWSPHATPRVVGLCGMGWCGWWNMTRDATEAEMIRVKDRKDKNVQQGVVTGGGEGRDGCGGRGSVLSTEPEPTPTSTPRWTTTSSTIAFLAPAPAPAPAYGEPSQKQNTNTSDNTYWFNFTSTMSTFFRHLAGSSPIGAKSSDYLPWRSWRTETDAFYVHVGSALGLLRFPAIRALCVGNGAFHFVLYLFMNWIPTLFAIRLGTPLSDIGLGRVWPYVALFATSITTSAASESLVASGQMSVRRLRTRLNTLGFLGAGLLLLCLPLVSTGLGGVVLITATFAALGVSRAGFAVNHMDVAPRQASVVLGLSNLFGTIAGVLSVPYVGMVLHVAGGAENTGGWWVVAWTCLVVLGVGAMFFHKHAQGDVVVK